MDSSDLYAFVINFLVSGTVAAICKTIFAPLERVKIILQNQASALQIITGERAPYKGFFDVLKRIPREQGVLSFWRGNAINAGRIFPLQAISFASFHVYKQRLSKLLPNSQYFVLYLSGGLAGATAGTVCYPLEFCLTRISTDVGSDKSIKKEYVKREFTGLTNCVSKVCHKEGVQGLYTGMAVQVPGFFFYKSMYFGIYDSLKILYLKFDKTPEKSPLHIPVLSRFFLAHLSTTLAAFVTYPVDTVGRRMMLESARPQEFRQFRHGFRNGFVQFYKQYGITGFYTGFLANVVRCTGSAVVLVLFEEISDKTHLMLKMQQQKKDE